MCNRVDEHFKSIVEYQGVGNYSVRGETIPFHFQRKAWTQFERKLYVVSNYIYWTLNKYDATKAERITGRRVPYTF